MKIAKNMLSFIIIIFLFTFYNATINAEGSIITNGQEDLKIDIINPVIYSKDKTTFLDINNKIVLYSSDWHYSTTKRNELTIDIEVEIEDGKHVVKEISETNDSEIPLTGYIISVPKTFHNNIKFSVGDILSGDILSNVVSHKYAIFGQEGVRTAITNINEPPGINGISLFNSNYGETTGLGQVFIEMIVDFDIEEMMYKVISVKEPFSSINEIVIPKNGFVIATRNVSTMMQFIENNKYKIGDEINLRGLNVFQENEEQYVHSYIAIDPTAQTNPSGASATAFRGADQMLIYTDKWSGISSDGFTGTNVHGFEVGVSEEGYIIERGTNVKIPNKGIVISGHGVEASFLRDNANIGGKVELNKTNNTMIISYPFFESKIVSIEIDLIESKKHIDYAKTMLFDVELSRAKKNYSRTLSIFDNMKSILSEIENMTNEDEINKKAVIFEILYNEGTQLLGDIIYLTMPNQIVESRSVWHHPREQSLEEMVETLDKLQEININLIFLASHWQGYSIFDSEIIEQHPLVKGFKSEKYDNDYLTAFLTEAKARNMEVHSWNLVLHAGVNVTWNDLPLSNVLRDNPEFHMVNFDGTITQNTIYMLDPANPKVHDLLASYYKELHTKYDLDGFQYDYIRYRPITLSTNPSEIIDGGYTTYAMNAFKEEYKYEGDLRQLVLNNSQINTEWSSWRREQVNLAVEKITNAVKSVDNGLNISMAVVSDPSYARGVYLQDWAKWIDYGWIDIIAPMIYHPSDDYVKTHVGFVQEKTKNLTFQYSGIGPVYYDYPIVNNQLQILAVNEGGAFGTAIFDSRNILDNEEFMRILKLSTNRNQAILPHSRTRAVVYSLLDSIIDRSTNIYSKNGVMSDEQLKNIVEQINKLKDYPTRNALEISRLSHQLEILYHYTETYISGEGINRIQDDLGRLISILDLKISRDLINRGLWDPKESLERPDVENFEYPDEPEEPGWPDFPIEPNEPEELEDSESDNPNENAWIYIIAGLIFIAITTGGLIFFKLRKRNSQT